ncbi:ABC transporter ATP-binding protein [Thermogladius sp.]|uniref:ABC transporter ATP-binding protein n=1 Tax=Thermogladius sp. TaxID=2023064 RepID=UPI003D1435BC
MPLENVVEMEKIVKVYPDGTVALRGVDFQLRKGEIHGLLGENGAGKTTLMKILAGILKPTRGVVRVYGRPVSFSSPSDALRLGIGMVAQYPALVPVFTVKENVFLGLSRREVSLEKLAKLMEETGLKVDPDAVTESLPMGLRQKTEILKILYRGVRVLILDEPTTNLTPMETEELFKTLRRLRDQGVSIVFISHKLKEVLSITDRITVLRRGVVTGVVDTSKTTPEELAKLMVGREVFLKIPKRPVQAGEEVLVVEDLWVRGDRGGWAVKGVSFGVRKGEIFGIAGVEGNGQKELVEALTGLRRADRGKVLLSGREVTNKTPQELYRLGLSHIPEDRVAMGLVVNMSVAENGILGLQRSRLFTNRLGLLKTKAIVEHVSKLVREYEIVVGSINNPARSLSGGNQQRLVLARELSKNPSIIVASNPTRGLDVASTEFVRRKLVEMRDQGKAILLVSADLDEVMDLSDRIAVMYEGRFMGVVDAKEADERLLGLMMGGYTLEQARQLRGG